MQNRCDAHSLLYFGIYRIRCLTTEYKVLHGVQRSLRNLSYNYRWLLTESLPQSKLRKASILHAKFTCKTFQIFPHCSNVRSGILERSVPLEEFCLVDFHDSYKSGSLRGTDGKPRSSCKRRCELHVIRAAVKCALSLFADYRNKLCVVSNQ